MNYQYTNFIIYINVLNLKMSNTVDISFLMTNAPSDEYRQQLLQLLNPSKTLVLKNKFKTIMSLIKFIDTECEKFKQEWETPACRLYGSFVRQFCEAVYSISTDIEYGDVTSHDVDICVFNDIEQNSDKKVYSEYYLKLINQFKMIILSKKDSFNFNGYNIIGIEDKTIRSEKKKEGDSNGRRLLYDIPHYEIVLENKSEEQIHVDLLAFAPNPDDDEFHLWNNDFNVNSLYITRKGIFTYSSNDSFFEIQKSIMDKYAISRYPVETFVKLLKRGSLKRYDKVKIYNQIIYYITYRMKILDDGYDTIYSDEKVIDLSVETNESCNITYASAPYIKLKLECQHEISIMAFASIVNIISSEYTETVCCPYCRECMIPLLIDKKPPHIEIPEFPKHTLYNREKVKPLAKKKKYISEENITTISGLLQGLNTEEIKERRERVRDGTIHNPQNGYYV